MGVETKSYVRPHSSSSSIPKPAPKGPLEPTSKDNGQATALAEASETPKPFLATSWDLSHFSES